MLFFFSCYFYRNYVYQHAQQAYLACLSLASADRDEVRRRGAQDTRDVRGFHFSYEVARVSPSLIVSRLPCS